LENTVLCRASGVSSGPPVGRPPRLITLVLGLCLATGCSEDGSSDATATGGAASAGAPVAGAATTTGGSSPAAGGAANAGGAPTGGASSGGGAAPSGGEAQGGGANGGSASGGTDDGGAPSEGGASNGGSAMGGTDGGGQAGDSGEGGAPAGGSDGGPLLESFRIAVIGSSTPAGEGASPGNGWVDLLDDALTEIVVVDFDVVNLAVGGYTTVELLPGSGADGGVDDAIDADPNLVLVALAGSNDLSNGTSQETFLERLTTMREAARDAGIPVFFVSTAPKDLSDDERQELADWSVAMASAFDPCWVPSSPPDFTPCYIDTFDLLASPSLNIAEEYSAGDGIHLNDAGHAVIYEAALDVVEPYVCSLVECG
jgi:lysophospholipase L1-like esterase